MLMELSEKTMNDVFRNRTRKYGDRLAIEKKMNGVWQSATWREYYERARAAGLGLYSLGVQKGNMVSILSDNRLEWLYTDMGSLGIGVCVIPIYPTLAAEEIEYILNNSESKIIIPENKTQLKKVLEIVDQCPGLEKIIVMEKKDVQKHPKIMSFRELVELGRKKQAEDPFLPLSHVFERIAGHFYGMYCGITSSYAQSIDTLLADFEEKRPTMILAVPRVCEKVYQKIIAQVKEQSSFKQKVFYWGQKVGSRISRLREDHKQIPLFLQLKYKIAYAIIFKKLQDKLGGRVTWMTASGAPTAPEIIRFFNAAGITVIQGYGMTETTAPATMQSLADYRIGTTGKPIPGQDIKIAEDGEILIKGGNVMKGYWKLPKETSESFTPDGYFMSGDIGKFDEEGNLLITDRKKDLLITSGGKNVAPQKIEGLFKSDPLFTQFIVIGEKKKYLTGLCNIDLDLASMIADDEKIPYQKPIDLLDNDRFLAIVKKHVEERNTHLAKYETIKDYRIVKSEFSQAGGELTATLKLKRKVVYEKYQDLIDDMYGKEAVDELYGKK